MAMYAGVYNAWNRLGKVRADNDSDIIAQYRHDGLNRRIRKLLPLLPPSTVPTPRVPTVLALPRRPL